MEVWKDIPNYVGIYMISNLGRIEILERKVKNRDMEAITYYTYNNKKQTIELY